jgi:hypothetical protein
MGGAPGGDPGKDAKDQKVRTIAFRQQFPPSSYRSARYAIV